VKRQKIKLNYLKLHFYIKENPLFAGFLFWAMLLL